MGGYLSLCVRARQARAQPRQAAARGGPPPDARARPAPPHTPAPPRQSLPLLGHMHPPFLKIMGARPRSQHGGGGGGG
jgi:hypothetical protein